MKKLYYAIPSLAAALFAAFLFVAPHGKAEQRRQHSAVTFLASEYTNGLVVWSANGYGPDAPQIDNYTPVSKAIVDLLDAGFSMNQQDGIFYTFVR